MLIVNEYLKISYEIIISNKFELEFSQLTYDVQSLGLIYFIVCVGALFYLFYGFGELGVGDGMLFRSIIY